MAGRGITFTETATLVTETCCSCGTLFAMTEAYIQQRRRDHAGWYCPNGHSQHYTGESEAERLRREVGDLKANRTFWQEEAERQKRVAAAAKGQVTKLRNRNAAGVCTDCNRTFQNVARHMQTKHGAHNEGMVGKL